MSVVINREHLIAAIEAADNLTEERSSYGEGGWVEYTQINEQGVADFVINYVSQLEHLIQEEPAANHLEGWAKGNLLYHLMADHSRRDAYDSDSDKIHREVHADDLR